MIQAYLILGTLFSGRRAAVCDMLSRGIYGEPRTSVLISSNEAKSEFDEKLSSMACVENFSDFDDAKLKVEEMLSTSDVLFYFADSQKNLIDEIENFKSLCDSGYLKLVRIIGVFDCALYSKKFDEVKEYYDAISHFSDCVLLSNRSGVKNGEIKKIKSRYEENYVPHIFQLEMKDGTLENPSMILVDEARRISMAFDDYDPIDEIELDEDTLPEEPFTIEKKEDPYFVRLENGTRAKSIPNILEILENFKNEQ